MYDARGLQQLPTSSKSTFQKVEARWWLSWKKADYSYDLGITADHGVGQSPIQSGPLLLMLGDKIIPELCLNPVSLFCVNAGGIVTFT